IESIYRSRPDEVSLIRNKWENHRQAEEEKRVKREQEIKEAMRKEELKPKEIEMSQAGPHIIVDALLNDKVRASLLLDTGASLILISRDIAKQLGIKTQGSERIEIMVTMADGREVKADYIVLESVNVQGAVARDIPAAVLSGKATVPEDGLLGMSFLDKFNFQIDSENKRLILQKRE
ncbi:MAG: retropepsin-like aspartic protease, partial [Candidatus Omnitrophota bacterium]